MKLKYESRFGRDHYTVGKRELLTLDEVMIDSARYKVTARIVHVNYCGFGLESSKHYFVRAKVFGKLQDFDLNSIKADITPCKYTTKAPQ